jgi:hypothetical protein
MSGAHPATAAIDPLGLFDVVVGVGHRHRRVVRAAVTDAYPPCKLGP